MNAERPSKSARKREYLALQDLGEELTHLGRSGLEALPLDDRLLQAVTEARNIQSRGALRRQRQLIGKLMRTADAEAIRASLMRLRQSDLQSTRLLHAAENWRDRVCAEGPPAIADFAAKIEGGTAALQQLVRELMVATDENRRRSIRRRIFREVHSRLADADLAVR